MGRAVTISDDGNRIAMSSPYHDGSAGYESGIVRVYQRSFQINGLLLDQ